MYIATRQQHATQFIWFFFWPMFMGFQNSSRAFHHSTSWFINIKQVSSKNTQWHGIMHIKQHQPTTKQTIIMEILDRVGLNNQQHSSSSCKTNMNKYAQKLTACISIASSCHTQHKYSIHFLQFIITKPNRGKIHLCTNKEIRFSHSMVDHLAWYKFHNAQQHWNYTWHSMDKRKERVEKLT